MPFKIVRNDITKVTADAIVNSANPRPIVGLGTDSSIHAAAGPRLLEARQAVGAIRPGEAAVTPAFNLDARFVIHTVGPVWRGGLFGEARKLRSCYDRSLRLALDNGCQSIAFPLISVGNYGFPREKALQIAIDAFRAFLLKNEMDITLVVFDRESFRLSEQRFRDISSYIDQNYVDAWELDTYGPEGNTLRQRMNRVRDADLYADKMPQVWEESRPINAGYSMPAPPAPSMAAPSKASSDKASPSNLKDMLQHTDAGFSETLLKLIDKTGQKDSAIYKKANVTKQHFSKIRNNPHYQPTKATAIAFAIALELDLDATKDLIGRAGYALTTSSKFDLIIMYFIQQHNYNMFDINATLFEFDQILLGV